MMGCHPSGHNVCSKLVTSCYPFIVIPTASHPPLSLTSGGHSSVLHLYNLVILRMLYRGQTAEARRTTILQPVEQNLHSQKDRQDEKAEGYVPDEGTR